MLDLAAIKSTPRTGDAPSQTERKSAEREKQNTTEREFRTAYESAAEESPQASKQNAETPDANEKSTDADRAVSENSAGEEAENTVAVGEGTSKQKDVLGTTKDEAVNAVRTDGKPARDPIEKSGSALVTRNVSTGATGTDVIGPPIASSEGAANTTLDAAALKKESSVKTTAETVIMTKAVENAQKDRSTGGADARATPAPVDVMKQGAVLQTMAGTAKIENKPAGTRKDDPLPRDAEFRVEASKSAANAPTLIPAQNNSLMAKSQTLAMTDITKDRLELTPVITGDADSFSAFETRSSTQASGASLAQILNRSDTPAMIARQMAEALQKLPDRPVEISLNPKELGRVRMNISAAEAGISVSIVAERPETLDLMRRNIEQLTREFQSIGYENISFAFAEGEENQAHSDEHGHEQPNESSRLELMSEDDTQNPVQPMMSAASGVDIRL